MTPPTATDGKQLPAALALAVFDAWLAPICVLDQHGTIVAANGVWHELAASRGGDARRTAEGVNYLDVAEAFASESDGDPWAQAFRDKLRGMLRGELTRFDQQYPCDAPDERRWFLARMRAFHLEQRLFVAVVHIDITALKRAELRAAGQVEVMTRLAGRASLGEVLSSVVHGVERENPALMCSVQLLNAAGSQLAQVVGPSLPRAYLEAIQALPEGPADTCSGSAAFTGRRTVSADIALDTRWHAQRQAALAVGLRACWCEPIRDAAGRVLGTLATYRRVPGAPGQEDILSVENAARFATVAIERRRSEEALYESEARFAHAFEDSAVGVAFLREDGTLFKANRALSTLLGYASEELCDTHLLAHTHPDDRARSEALAARLRSGELEVYQQEKRYLHKSGRPVWVLLSVSTVRGERGQPLYAIAQILDLTAIRAARDERDLIFRYSLDLLCLADIHGTFKQINPAWTRVLGWSEQELLCRPFVELVHAEDQAATREAVATLAAGQPVIEFENRYRCKDGGYRLLSWNAFPLPQDGAALAVVRDVTARKAAEEARREADARLHEGQKLESLGALAGGIAHDFNNLLAVILGNVNLAARGLAQGQGVDEHLHQIQLASQRALDLVRQIMAFSRRQPRELREVCLAEVVGEALQLLRATIPAGVEIDASLDGAAPPVYADGTQMHQVLMNLCTNAWRALQPVQGRQPRIQVTLGAVPAAAPTPPGLRSELPPGPLVELRVSDNGVGMDEATAARVFEPFFTTRPAGEGTGLGLSVVHGIVAAHQGAIAVESTPGIGTTFSIYLPVSPRTGRDAGADAAAAAAASPAAARRLKLMFIDDEAALVRLGITLLEDDGHQVEGYTDVDAALAALDSAIEPYDVVISDFNMPRQSGIEVARAVAARASGVPVIIASGYITPELQFAAADCGVARLLHKPDMATRLCATVAEVAATRY